jgi:L,D-peptidoglycan transpeptidase YkuD (ErfK/YbiS/YcfS/YnhG family)
MSAARRLGGLLRIALPGALLVALLSACAGKPLPREGVDPTAQSRQMLLVVAEGWNYTEATLRRFERASAEADWRPVGDETPVNLGRKGLGWGRGLHGLALGAGPVKKEGDGRAPAGVFALGDGFAQDPAEVGPVRVPVLRNDADLVCVDDVKSRYYNELLRLPAPGGRDWDSQETMPRPDGMYRYGAFVKHNAAPVTPGAGSCIFLHVWLARGVASSGCTNMEPAQMLALLRWLDADKRPVLVQLARNDYERLREDWRLPR